MKKVKTMKSKVMMLLCLVALFLVACQEEGVTPALQETPPPLLEQESSPAPIIEAAKPSIQIIRIPSTVRDDEQAGIRWKIGGEQPLTATHTAIHYDDTSHAGTLDLSVAPVDSGYSSFTKEFASGEFSLPEEFTASFSVPEGADKVYLRAHAIIDGKNYWSEERSIAIVNVGCAYNNPSCGNDYDCIDNECTLKPGCNYRNPACEEGYRCENNECVRISRGGGGGY